MSLVTHKFPKGCIFKMVYPQSTHIVPTVYPMVHPKWEQELSLVKGGNPGLVLVLVVC